MVSFRESPAVSIFNYDDFHMFWDFWLTMLKQNESLESTNDDIVGNTVTELGSFSGFVLFEYRG